MHAHDLPAAIQWHEGLLLSPQHFQQAAMRAEGLVHYHMAAAHPYHWGIRRLRFDPTLLANGTVRVLELEAVLPDGLVVSHSAGAGSEVTLDLKPHVQGRVTGTLTVQLAVPALRSSGEPLIGRLERYESVDGEPCVDENTGENPIAIPRLRPRAAVIVGDTAPEKYTAFPLARIAFRNESFSLTDYIPPVLRVEPGSDLGAWTGQFARRLREKAVFVSERVRASAALSTGTHVAELENMMEKFMAGLPLVEALLGSASAHPFQLYLALCSVAGQVASIGLAVVPPPFRRYDHNELRASFEPVLAFCNGMLDQVHESYSIVPFHFADGSFRLTLRPEWASETLIIGAASAPGGDEGSVVGWVESSCIGSEKRMPTIRERRVRGAERKRIESADELSLIPTRGIALFRVHVDPDFIESGGVLEIVQPAAHSAPGQPQEIVLYTAS